MLPLVQPGITFSPALGNAGQLLHEEINAFSRWATLAKRAFMGVGRGSLGLSVPAHLQMQGKSRRDSLFMAPGLQSFPPKLTRSFPV